MIKPKFVNNEIYHIYNRGVEKRLIFGSDKDRFRFVHNLYEMNDSSPVLNNGYWIARDIEVQLRYTKERDKLVEILAFCLMPNHYHLLLRQTQEKGIVRFMQKLGTAYTNYFNLRNERVGPLFQGRFKAVLIGEDGHLRHIYNYIHLNPLDLSAPEWRENKFSNRQKALDFLDSYRWSSYLDYTGKKNFPSVIDKKLGLEIFSNTKNYSENIQEWLGNIEKYEDKLSDFTLE